MGVEQAITETNTLFAAGRVAEAEAVIQQACSEHSDNANCHALHGYLLGVLKQQEATARRLRLQTC